MNKKTQLINRPHQINTERKTNSSGKMRFFYILMLLLMIFSLFLRASGAGRGIGAQAGGGTAARILVFHHNDENLCEDLVITSAENAVFSNCGNGIEKQYVLSNTERAQLQNWIGNYKAVNYDHSDPAQAGTSMTRLYLDGRGNHQASDEEIQQLTNFAANLAAKIVSSP